MSGRERGSTLRPRPLSTRLLPTGDGRLMDGQPWQIHNPEPSAAARKLMASRDCGGPRANTRLLHHELMASNKKKVASFHILPISWQCPHGHPCTEGTEHGSGTAPAASVTPPGCPVVGAHRWARPPWLLAAGQRCPMLGSLPARASGPPSPPC